MSHIEICIENAFGILCRMTNNILFLVVVVPFSAPPTEMQMVLWCMYAVELKFSMPY